MSRILVVDDEPDSVSALCKYLDQDGFIVDRATNGQEALSRIIDNKPDLVALDVYMPLLDGVSLLEIMRSYLTLRAVPVIILTGMPDSPLLEKARTLRVSDVFIKGRASLIEIGDAIKTALRRTRG
jgi:two-component system phosphate regulon response regulator PhoB